MCVAMTLSLREVLVNDYFKVIFVLNDSERPPSKFSRMF